MSVEKRSKCAYVCTKSPSSSLCIKCLLSPLWIGGFAKPLKWGLIGTPISVGKRIGVCICVYASVYEASMNFKNPPMYGASWSPWKILCVWPLGDSWSSLCTGSFTKHSSYSVKKKLKKKNPKCARVCMCLQSLLCTGASSSPRRCWGAL